MDYQLWFANPQGQRLSTLCDWSSVTYTLAVNTPTMLTLDLPASALQWSWIQRDSQLEVWRNGRLVPTLWFVRGRRTWTDTQGRKFIRLTAQSALGLLDRRIIAYRASSSQAQKTALTDNLMKAIVRENFGNLATDTARQTSLVVDGNTGQGTSVTKAFAWRNVLKTLQELSQASMTATPIFFDVTWNGETLTFQTFKNLRGTDHSADSAYPVEVSLERGNLTEPLLDEDWSNETSVIYAGGAGQEDLRLLTTASNSVLISASPWGRSEDFVNASQCETAAALQSEATAKLRQARGKVIFTGQLQDTDQCRYGQHWDFGDQLAVSYDGASFTCRVDAVQVNVSNGKEIIKAALRGEQ